MKNSIKIRPEDMRSNDRKISREIELEINGGRWITKHRIHKSAKTYSRKINKSKCYE